MNLDKKNINSFRYLYLLQTDGIGSLFIHISQLLDYAEQTGCTVLVDFRKASYFSGEGLSFEDSEAKNVFIFESDQIVCNSEIIDRILQENTDQVAGILFSEELYFPAGWDLTIISAEQLLNSIDHKCSACYLKDKLKLAGIYQERFHKYRQIIPSCIGVHARFGNGEYERNVRNQHLLQRMRVSRQSFFAAMDAHPDEKLFLCTDTPSFLEQCIKKYGDRLIYLDRFMPPEGYGPGHNIWPAPDEQSRQELLQEKIRIGPYRILGEALVEMFLLGECKRLICNESSFTHYARQCCENETVLLSSMNSHR